MQKNNFFKIFKYTLTACLTIGLTGCGTILSGTSQKINIRVVDSATHQPLKNIRYTITDGAGLSETVIQNPHTITVSRQGGPVSIQCHEKGYRQLNTRVGDSFNATSALNVLFWPGFIVDAATGAYKKFPSHYIVQMEKLSSEKSESALS